MFSQAEHDALAQSILISPDKDLLKKVEDHILKELPNQVRKSIIESSLQNFGLLINSKDIS